jgi:hypothetical protein
MTCFLLSPRRLLKNIMTASMDASVASGLFKEMRFSELLVLLYSPWLKIRASKQQCGLLHVVEHSKSPKVMLSREIWEGILKVTIMEKRMLDNSML